MNQQQEWSRYADRLVEACERAKGTEMNVMALAALARGEASQSQSKPDLSEVVHDFLAIAEASTEQQLAQFARPDDTAAEARAVGGAAFDVRMSNGALYGKMCWCAASALGREVALGQQEKNAILRDFDAGPIVDNSYAERARAIAKDLEAAGWFGNGAAA